MSSRRLLQPMPARWLPVSQKGTRRLTLDSVVLDTQLLCGK